MNRTILFLSLITVLLSGCAGKTALDTPLDLVFIPTKYIVRGITTGNFDGVPNWFTPEGEGVLTVEGKYPNLFVNSEHFKKYVEACMMFQWIAGQRAGDPHSKFEQMREQVHVYHQLQRAVAPGEGNELSAFVSPDHYLALVQNRDKALKANLQMYTGLEGKEFISSGLDRVLTYYSESTAIQAKAAEDGKHILISVEEKGKGFSIGGTERERSGNLGLRTKTYYRSLYVVNKATGIVTGVVYGDFVGPRPYGYYLGKLDAVPDLAALVIKIKDIKSNENKLSLVSAGIWPEEECKNSSPAGGGNYFCYLSKEDRDLFKKNMASMDNVVFGDKLPANIITTLIAANPEKYKTAGQDAGQTEQKGKVLSW